MSVIAMKITKAEKHPNADRPHIPDGKNALAFYRSWKKP